MSFVESVFSAGFIQKIVKVDLNVKVNHAYLSRKQLQKVPRSHATEADMKRITGGAARPHLQVGRPLGPPIGLRLAMSVLHCLKDYIYAIYSSRFDPRAQN